MSCHYLRNCGPAPGRWHRLWCTECRAACTADATLSLGVECMKAQPFPDEGLARTLSALGLPPSPALHKRRLRRIGRRLLLSAGALSLLLTLGGYSWLRALDSYPNIPVPTPILPVPNAFDSFRAAGAALVEEKKTSSVLLALTGTPQQQEQVRKSLDAPPRRLEAQLLKENSRALQLVREGFAYPYQEPPVRSMNTLFSHHTTFRSLARLLVLEAHAKAERRDWRGAVNSGLDAIQLGAKTPRGAVLVGKLSGISIEAIGRKAVWNAVPRLNAAEAQAAAQRLKTILSLHVPFAETLKEEKWCGLASLQTEILTPGWRFKFDPYQPMIESSEPADMLDRKAHKMLYALMLMQYSKREIIENYVRYMDQRIAEAQLPLPKPSALALPDDPVCQMLLPVFDQAAFRDMASDVQNRLLYTTLLLRAYRLEKGRYPASLEQLVPHYLKGIPGDPFRPNYELSYRREGDTYVLYSLGPDGKDNGGSACYKPSTRPEEQYCFDALSMGDVVAGKSWN
jgi:hypothetical protein